jgi:ABC-type oligopeptide transport system substrate-binding subunit
MRIRACTFLIAATTLLNACSSDRSASGTGGGTVIVSLGSDAGTLFPVTVQDETGVLVITQLFDHLADIGAGHHRRRGSHPPLGKELGLGARFDVHRVPYRSRGALS